MDTQQKYNEAEYFFGMMKENIEDPRRVKYNLSAFTSAARSVRYFLEKECSKNTKLDEWYCKTQIQMKRNELFNFFKNKRDHTIHKGTIDMRSNIEIEVPPVEIGLSVSSVEAIIIKADGTIKDKKDISESPVKPKITPKQDDTEITEYKWFFKNCPNEYRNVDVITLCQKYLNELKIIVEEAESKFSEANTS